MKGYWALWEEQGGVIRLPGNAHLEVVALCPLAEDLPQRLADALLRASLARHAEKFGPNSLRLPGTGLRVGFWCCHLVGRGRHHDFSIREPFHLSRKRIEALVSLSAQPSNFKDGKPKPCSTETLALTMLSLNYSPNPISD